MSNEPKYITDTDGIIGDFLSNYNPAMSKLKRRVLKELRAAYARGYKDGRDGKEPTP